MLYSFPKASRFIDHHKPLCDNIYNIPDKFSRRKAGIGYGNKSNFCNEIYVTPAPSEYNITA